ncbi:OmpA family protein [Prosthecobacter sp.]|uniref:OmpA family protein n=1 Tax=Prosthecobacter sp. TaxID=1965333 RepID=UPI00378511C8
MMNDAQPKMNRRNQRAIRTALLCSSVLLASCGSLPMPSFLSSTSSEAVVFALGPREGYTSPLSNSLKPACPALVFENADFRLTESHQHALRGFVQEMSKGNKKARLLIAGYAPPNLPQDHARSISERRALAVRQRLIELGLEAANLQTVGFGNDFSPSGPSSDVVVIYRQ